MANLHYDFSDRTVVITGASKGIGRACAEGFLAAGATVIAASRSGEFGLTANSRLIPMRADVSREADVEAIVQEALTRTGALDAFVNNAGIIEAPTPITDQTQDLFDSVFATNVRGVFFGIKHAGRAMADRKKGAIINISSVAGQAGSPGLAPYAASKFAVAGLMRSAALELAPFGVRVVSVLPHATETPMMKGFVGEGETEGRIAIRRSVPLGRMAAPEEQANAVLFLAAQESAFITGAELAVDGGRLA